jgi:hypothetical protein
VLAAELQIKGEKTIGTNFRRLMIQLQTMQGSLRLAERLRISGLTQLSGKCKVLVLKYSQHKEDVWGKEV